MEAPDTALVRRIHTLFKEKRLSLSVAESCTGGLISHLITALPGASEFLDSAFVTYSIESKTEVLGVKGSLIERHGVISEETAEAMAVGVRKKRNTGYSLAVTGNLGPTALEDKAVGLVFIAVDREGETVSKGMIFEGGREEIKEKAALAALELLREVVEVWG